MNRLRQLREQNHLSLSKLGEKLGMSAAVLGNYERGDREPKVDIWKKIANFFDVDTAYLMGLTDSPRSEQNTIDKKTFLAHWDLGFNSYYRESIEEFIELSKSNDTLKRLMMNINIISKKAKKEEIESFLLLLDSISKFYSATGKKQKYTPFKESEKTKEPDYEKPNEVIMSMIQEIIKQSNDVRSASEKMIGLLQENKINSLYE
ncbi:hypothetical protein CYR81_07020 [Enterococcus faecalis]|uniref:helix-turn-helix domain-containing protein n=1 Tax=Enterococcus faecalis TaxID=1351 RepID=UPI000C766D4B|nr:helix-turn-helix domain-containing protein [Enterococcus faecalis]PLA80805.1 hypothetical protein CYR81_07020 [Enterococcus faecalis]